MEQSELVALGALLQRHRERRGLTQEQLAERAGAGLSVRTVSNLERGRTRPQAHTLAALANALGLSEAERADLLAARGALVAHPAVPSAAAAAVQPGPPPAPPPAPGASPFTGLPAPLTPLVGREREEAAVAHLLRQGARLVTLTGPGGVGKTRLALQVASGLGDAFPDGVVLVELAPLRDPALVLPTLARTLGLREDGGMPLAAQLRAALASRRVLLVLDNFEHLLDAAPPVAELLAACPGVAALVTSRAALRVRGEQEFPVPPLALPAPGAATDPRALATAPAVTLFVQRARAVRPDLALTPDNAAAVAAICRRLDGLPLALELAAARLKLLPPQALLARLERRLVVLSGGSRDLPDRQRTLRHTLDWSYDLLAPGDQRLLRRLGVFVGGCTLDAAEAVAGDPADAPGLHVLDGVASLIDKSLLQQTAGGPQAGTPGELRYTMLETVREYALERLEASGEAGEVRRRHAAYYLALADEAGPAILGAEQLAWLTRLDAEHDNLRAALAWYVEHDPETGLRLAGSLGQFWRAHGYSVEGQRWLDELLARAPERTVWRARALLWAGILAYTHVDLAPARAWLEESVALSRALGETRLMAWALRELGHVSIWLGDWPRAREVGEEGLALIRQLGDARGLGANLGLLGRVASMEGDYGRARDLYEESLAVLRRVGDRYLISSELSYFGQVALVTGEAGRAEALFAEGLAAARELGAPQMIAPYHWHLGNVALWQGDTGRAAALYEEGVARSRERQDTVWIARNLAGLGRVAQRQGDTARAAALLQESLTLCTAIEHTFGVAVALHGLGLVAQARGDGRQALALLRQSLALCQQLGERLAVVECLEGLALVLAEGQPRQAGRLLGAATRFRAGMGAPLPLSARETYDRLLADLRAHLGEDAFLAAWDTGQGLSLAEAIAEALASTDPPPLAVVEEAVAHRPTTALVYFSDQSTASRYHDPEGFRE